MGKLPKISLVKTRVVVAAEFLANYKLIWFWSAKPEVRTTTHKITQPKSKTPPKTTVWLNNPPTKNKLSCQTKNLTSPTSGRNTTRKPKLLNETLLHRSRETGTLKLLKKTTKILLFGEMPRIGRWWDAAGSG